MRICFISTEMAGIGSFGGFGVLTRDISLGVAERGHEVTVVMPRQPDQKPIEQVQGLTVLSYKGGLYSGLKRSLPFAGVYRMVDADVYHTQEPSIGTRLAQIGAPDKKHIVTFQDPRNIEDWRRQWAPRVPTRYQEFKFLRRYKREIVPGAQNADARYCQAKYITEKAMDIFGIKERPGFLPNPVPVPDSGIVKSETPTVCFVGRWDDIKRPELFIDLAERNPEVTFILMGACLNDTEKDARIRDRGSKIPNIEMPGWLNVTERNEILNRSWILINTSTKECLPVTYLEACAYKCAVLSHGNADEFPSTFGYWAEVGDLDDYHRGLTGLLKDNRWRELGEKGYKYVKETHSYDKVIDKHIHAYEGVLEK